jgi:6-phosphogluconolactonase
MMRSIRVSALVRSATAICFCSLFADCAGSIQQTLPTTQNAIKHRARISMAGGACTALTNTANFNGNAIPNGDTIWFTSVIKAQGLANTPVTINMTNATVSFTASGVPYTVTVPNFAVTFNPSATTASLSYSGSWNETVPSSIGGNVLVGAVEFPVTTSLPGGIQNVTWAATFTSTQQSGLTLNWAWSAAVYSQFNADYTQLGVKPVDDNKADPLYQNSDPAGTPENYKSYVVGGAMGGGGSNYTGGLSGTLAVTPCLAPQPEFVYVPNSISNNISAYAINMATGALTPVAGSPFAAGNSPNYLAMDENQNFLYVTNSQSGNISAYAINATTGVLTPITGSPFAAQVSLVSVASDPTGNFLYTVACCYSANVGSINAYTIDETSGALNPVTGSPFASGAAYADAAVVDQAGPFLYVSNNGVGTLPTGPSTISAFTIAANGSLSAVSGSPFAAPGSVGLDDAAVYLGGKFLYVSDPNGSTISAFTIAGNGMLAPVAGSPFSAGNVYEIAINPSGTFLYDPGQQDSQLFAYAIDGTSGALTPIPGSPYSVYFGTGAAIDPTGNFLYVTSTNGGNFISGYAINPSSGALTPVPGSPFATGSFPNFVVIR